MTKSNDNPVRPGNPAVKSVHKVFATFLLPLLGAVLAVHMQAKSRSPFDTHPGSMWTFIASVIIYCCAFSLSTYLQSQRSRSWMSNQPYWFLEKLSLYAVAAFCSLAAVCLLSPLLPGLVGCLVFFLWGLIVSISIGFQLRTLLISKAWQTQQQLLPLSHSPDLMMIQQQHRPTQQAEETHCSYSPSTTPEFT